MGAVSTKYSIQNVHKLNLVIIWAMIILLLINNGIVAPSTLPVLSIQCAAILFIVTVIYFIKIKDEIKGLLICLTPWVVVFISMITDQADESNHYIIFIFLVMISLYFNKKLVLIYGAVINLCLIGLSVVSVKNYLVKVNDPKDAIIIFIYLNGAITLLYFLTKWVSELVLIANNKEIEAKEVLHRLQDTFGEVDNCSQALDTDIRHITEGIYSNKEASDNITSTMQQVSTGVSEQSENIVNINEKIIDISKNINKSRCLSDELSSISNEMTLKVEEGSNGVELVNSQMFTINDVINVALETVTELEKSIVNINSFLGSITQISEKTNLLALNAAIEAARAGEQGRGFAVVADEVRNLAEQSSDIVENINKIITTVGEQIKTAVEKVSLGESAVTFGNELIKDLSKQFFEIKEAFDNVNNTLKSQNGMVTLVSDDIQILEDEVQSIASISQQQAAASEEVLATLESQNNNVSDIVKAVDNINSLSGNLRKLTTKEN